MSLIRKHVAVLQAWACLALVVLRTYSAYGIVSATIARTVAEICCSTEFKDTFRRVVKSVHRFRSVVFY